MVAAFASLVAYGLATHPDKFAIATYATLLSVAPTSTWAWAWAIVAVLLAAAAISGRVRLWLLGSTAAVGVAVCWMIGLSWAHFIEGADLSAAGFALWSYFVLSQVFVLSAPRKFE